MVAGPGGITEEDVGDSDRSEVDVVAASLAEDRTHELGLQPVADRGADRINQAGPARLGADREADGPKTWQEIRTLDVEVDVRDGVRVRDQWVLDVVLGTEQPVFLAVPECDDDGSVGRVLPGRDGVANFEGECGAGGVVGRAVTDRVRRGCTAAVRAEVVVVPAHHDVLVRMHGASEHPENVDAVRERLSVGVVTGAGGVQASEAEVSELADEVLLCGDGAGGVVVSAGEVVAGEQVDVGLEATTAGGEHDQRECREDTVSDGAVNAAWDPPVGFQRSDRAGRSSPPGGAPRRCLACACVATIEAADGTVIAFEETGQGRDLVLVHGITESRRAWDPVIPHLAERWRVVAVDLRGHGDSGRQAPYDPATLATDVGAVVDHLALDEPLMVGHSLGGVVVSVYAGARLPSRGVVNVDQMLRLAAFQEALAPLEPMLRGDEASFREAVGIVFSVLDGSLPAAERERLNALSSPETEVVLGVWDPVLDASPGELDDMAVRILRGIDVPYLALHGSDPGPQYVQWLLGLVRETRLEVWPDVGHYPHLVDPERFRDRLEQFDENL